MGMVFKGWRRKAGCVTLILALVLMGGWFRSRFNLDDVEIPFGDASYGVTSMGGGLDFYRISGMDKGLNTIYSSNVLTLDKDGNPVDVIPWSAQHEIEWRWDWAGFHFGVSRLPTRRDEDYMIPYWSVVTPLTLLSAFLFLSKPRKSNQKKFVEPAPAEGT